MDLLSFSDIEVRHIGPSFKEGPLPAVFYFALSAEESLTLDPYNQPVLFLSQCSQLRIFSLTLPFHGANLNPLEAIGKWALAIAAGEDPLHVFIDQIVFVIENLIKEKLVVPDKVSCMGLSRGGLISCHVATKFDVHSLVCFAPLTKLTAAREFENLYQHPLANSLNLENHLLALCQKQIRFYIGNRDVRVGTALCFDLVEKLVDTAFKKGIRSPMIELMITPSIGHLGHGTSRQIFEEGASWLGKKLGVLP